MADVVSPVWEIIKDLWTPLIRQIRHARHLHENLDQLETDIEELDRQRQDVQTELQAGQSDGSTPKVLVQGWLKDVEEMTNRVKSFLKAKHDKACLMGLFPDYMSRVRESNRALKMVEEVAKLKNKGEFTAGLTNPPPRPPPPTEIPVEEMLSCRSTEEIKERIIKCLEDDGVGRIGVWGMGGVGKTTLAKHIHNYIVNKKHLFDHVMFVTVSNEPLNLNRLQKAIFQQILTTQDEIFKCLSLDSTEMASRHLFSRLKGKRFFLILDDMWKQVDLFELGVPNPSKENRSKLLLTTRSNGVCSGMETGEQIKVSPLDHEEAWKLFCDKAGDVASMLEIKPFAEQVVRECDGLPLAIVTVARAMRGKKDTVLWKNASRELRDSASRIMDLDDMVFARLRFSYDNLRSNELRECFLYCSLFNTTLGVTKHNLITRWWIDGLLSERGANQYCSLEKAEEIGTSILEDLKDSLIVTETKNEDTLYVYLHDLMVDLASKITKGRYIVKVGNDFHNQDWRTTERISLSFFESGSLPEIPDCPNISTMLLMCNTSGSAISAQFFTHMRTLRVLELYNISIKYLPPSIAKLSNLGYLSIDDCPNLKGFLHVEIPPKPLHLPEPKNDGCSKGTVIQEVNNDNSKSIVHLFPKLQVLRMIALPLLSEITREGVTTTATFSLSLPCIREISICDCPKLSILPLTPGSRAQFEYLEILDVRDCEALEEIFHTGDETATTSSLSLPYIREIVIYDCPKLRKLPLTPESIAQFEYLKRLHAQRCEALEEIFHTRDDTAITSSLSLPCIREIVFYDCPKLRNLPLTPGSIAQFEYLETLHVRRCEALEEIFHAGDEIATTSSLSLPYIRKFSICDCPKLRNLPLIPWSIALFGYLETLDVQRCEALEEILHTGDENATTSSLSLPCVREVTVYNCPKLLNIPLVLRDENSFGALKELDVQDCESLEEIFHTNKEISMTMNFPKLRKLRLWGLSSLEKICKGMAFLNLPSLETIVVVRCPKLQNFLWFKDGQLPPNLKFIGVDEQWWNGLVWGDDKTKQALQQFLKFF